MPTQKIDPRVVFASNAPAVDKPPVFGDKTKGWDVARANDGRPTIKEMNKVQQDTDLKILWLNENSVTPYDASIDYPDGAVSIKDGSFKQLSSGAWVEFLDDFADKDAVKRGIANRYDPSLTYNSGERVILTNGDIVKSTIDGNTNDPNVDMTGWEITDNGFVLVDSRKLGLVGDLSSDQSVAVTACNNYVNSIPVNKDTPIVLRLPKGLVKSSVGFAFDRQTILFAQGDSLFEYTGSEYAVRLGKLNVTDYTDGFRTFGVKGVSFTGADNCTHGIYVSQYVLSPTLESVKFLDFGNASSSNSYNVFFQGHNWDIYIRNCKLDNITKNNINLIRINGVLTDGMPDYGNSRLNLIDSFFNQGGNDCAGVGVFLNSFKSRIIGGGFQGYKNCIQLGEYGQTPEINGTYFESIYQNCESIFKIGEDGYTSEKVFSDISLLNIYANLHNINNEYGNTDVKFLTTAQNVKLSNLKIDNIKTLNGDKYPLLSLQNLSGQTCDLGNVSHSNALLHNIRDDQMVVVNPKENHFPNSDLKVWQRGSTFSFVSGVKKLADGFRLIGDGSTGNINIYNESVLSEYNFPSDAVGMMRIVRTAVSTDASYCTIRARIGELSVLSGHAANLSFVAKADKDMSINVTLVRDYGSNIEYISAGSVAIKSGSTANTYAKSFNIPMLNRSYAKTTAARTYVDITLPTNLLFVLDISCFSLQQGYVKSGWESNSYAKDFDLASEFYQVGGYNVVTSGQLKIQIPLRRMRYTPTITSHVAYQDAVVNYNATTPIVEQARFVTLLNAVANDVSINWTADAEI